VRAETSDTAFRLLLALGEIWDTLQRASADPSHKGLHLRQEYVGGYTRICAGPGSHWRLIIEWNESSRDLRILRSEEWHGFEAAISATVAHVRQAAGKLGIADVVDAKLVQACQDTRPFRRTNRVPATAVAAVRR
jgi:hypothetical protein